MREHRPFAKVHVELRPSGSRISGFCTTASGWPPWTAGTQLFAKLNAAPTVAPWSSCSQNWWKNHDPTNPSADAPADTQYHENTFAAALTSSALSGPFHSTPMLPLRERKLPEKHASIATSTSGPLLRNPWATVHGGHGPRPQPVVAVDHQRVLRVVVEDSTSKYPVPLATPLASVTVTSTRTGDYG
ncbi:MAG: hypothetical protein Kow0069_12560 [Promethearchaeota archaeon]